MTVLLPTWASSLMKALCLSCILLNVCLATPDSRLPWSRYKALTFLHQPCDKITFTVGNVFANLGPSWPITVFHNADVYESLASSSAITEFRRKGFVALRSLESAGFVDLDRDGTDAYSAMLASPKFWDMVNAHKVVIFQTDAAICSSSPWTIDDFLSYDYIGAPWADRHFGLEIGNGGFSLRSVALMKHITATYELNGVNEDIYFADAMRDMQASGLQVALPDVATAAKFAYESGRPPSVPPFAVHRYNIPQNMDSVARRYIIKYCPEAFVGVWRPCRPPHSNRGKTRWNFEVDFELPPANRSSSNASPIYNVLKRLPD